MWYFYQPLKTLVSYTRSCAVMWIRSIRKSGRDLFFGKQTTTIITIISQVCWWSVDRSCELFLPQGNIPPTSMLTWDRTGVVQIAESLADLEILLPKSSTLPPPSPTDLTAQACEFTRVDHKPVGNGVAMSQIPVISTWAGCHCGSASSSWNSLEAKSIIIKTDHTGISGEGLFIIEDGGGVHLSSRMKSLADLGLLTHQHLALPGKAQITNSRRTTLTPWRLNTNG